MSKPDYKQLWNDEQIKNAALEERLQIFIQNSKADRLSIFIHDAIKYGTVCFIFLTIYRIIDALAGKTTDASVSIFGELRGASQIVSALMTAGSVWFGVAQRNLRIKAVETRDAEKTALENRVVELSEQPRMLSVVPEKP